MRNRCRLRRRRAWGCLGLMLLIIIICFAWMWRNEIAGHFFPREYESIVTAACASYGIDPFLIMAVIREESGFQPDAVSAVGARGLMQLMPQTAEWVITKAGFSFSAEEALSDPATNIAVGVWYIDWLDSTYYGGSSLPAAIAAYNAGHGNVDKWLKDGLWDGTMEGVDGIPYAETRRYLQYVYRSYELYSRLYGR